MASDNITQLGKRLRKTKQNIQHTSRRVNKNFAVVEESSDIVGSINTYKFEFKTYDNNPSVFLDISIKEKFRSLHG